MMMVMMMIVMVMKPREGFRPTSSAEKGPVPGPHPHPHLALSPLFWWCLKLSELLGWGVPPLSENLPIHPI